MCRLHRHRLNWLEVVQFVESSGCYKAANSDIKLSLDGRKLTSLSVRQQSVQSIQRIRRTGNIWISPELPGGEFQHLLEYGGAAQLAREGEGCVLCLVHAAVGGWHLGVTESVAEHVLKEVSRVIFWRCREDFITYLIELEPNRIQTPNGQFRLSYYRWQRTTFGTR